MAQGPVDLAGRVNLSPRERQVLEAMWDGLDGRATARRLGLALATVRGYQKSLRGRLGVQSQLEVLAEARRLGLTPCACGVGAEMREGPR